jgi:hypothetical protein
MVWFIYHYNVFSCTVCVSYVSSPTVAHRFFLVWNLCYFLLDSVVGWIIRRDVCCYFNWLMDHFSPDSRNSLTETVRFVISLRSIFTFSVQYLSRQHMVLSPQTVMVSRHTITTSVLTTTHYIVPEHCLAKTRWIFQVQRCGPQNDTASRPMCTASCATARQMRKRTSINTQVYIFV